MDKKMGRPTNNPKTHRESFRLSENDMEKLNFCLKYGNMNKTEVIRKGIDRVYNEIRATNTLDK